MHAARDFDPAAVLFCGGPYSSGQFVDHVGYEGRNDIDVRRPSDNQRRSQIPDAGAQGIDPAV